MANLKPYNLFEYTALVAKIESMTTVKDLGAVAREVAFPASPGNYCRYPYMVYNNLEKSKQSFETMSYNYRLISLIISRYSKYSKTSLPSYCYEFMNKLAENSHTFFINVPSLTFSDFEEFYRYNKEVYIGSTSLKEVKDYAIFFQDVDLTPYTFKYSLILHAINTGRLLNAPTIFYLAVLDAELPNTGNYSYINKLMDQEYKSDTSSAEFAATSAEFMSVTQKAIDITHNYLTQKETTCAQEQEFTT